MTALEELVADSLVLWRIDARFEGGRVLAPDGTEVRISAADGPFRWSLAWRLPGETWDEAARARFPRHYASVAGLLKGLRMTLEPGWRPPRARIAGQPLVG